ncbi:hypothetical protein EVAR_51536_1 [Eumeta japonica]|uniref:Uncharacterized protein n=1 Tax=Eumeta variegata TaxID=151549 RepID=A0A4C1XCP6_EUMVA|nr:hypothetical protein EVAR_51536_1 [Eumeta japonica]
MLNPVVFRRLQTITRCTIGIGRYLPRAAPAPAPVQTRAAVAPAHRNIQILRSSDLGLLASAADTASTSSHPAHALLLVPTTRRLLGSTTTRGKRDKELNLGRPTKKKCIIKIRGVSPLHGASTSGARRKKDFNTQIHMSDRLTVAGRVATRLMCQRFRTTAFRGKEVRKSVIVKLQCIDKLAVCLEESRLRCMIEFEKDEESAKTKDRRRNTRRYGEDTRKWTRSVTNELRECGSLAEESQTATPMSIDPKPRQTP